MKLYRFHNPQDYRFAEAGVRGTWYPEPSPGLCPQCGASQLKRIPPLIIEWLPGSDKIGDFVWPGREIVVSQQVREVLEEQFEGFEFKPVEMWQNLALRRPQQVNKRTKPRIWLPYVGPPLCDLWITTWVHLDTEQSSIQLIKACEVCGYKEYEVKGVEIKKSQWNSTKNDLDKIHIPRVEGKGIYIPDNDLQGADVFRVFEVPAWVFCSEKVKSTIEAKEFNNISFLEVGDII